jgi:hypothetical protein
MKKGLLTFIAASALCMGASAQSQYIMQVTKTNGQVELINADEVQSVSFIEGALSPKVMMMNEVRNSLYGIASKKLNFTALNLGNTLLAEMTKVLVSDESLIAAMQQDVMGKLQSQIKDVEEGSELAAAGYQKYLVIDYRMFDGVYSFSEYGEMTKGEAAGKLEVNFPIETEAYTGNVRTVFGGSGDVSEMLVPYSKDNSIALIIRLPQTLSFVMSDKGGAPLFDGKLNFTFEKKSEGSSYYSPLQDKWLIVSEMNAHLKDLNDENTLNMAFGYDPSTGSVVLQHGFAQNGQEIISRNTQVTLPILTQIPMIIQMASGMTGLNNGSPLDMIAQILASGSVKEMAQSISYMLLNGATIDEYEVTLLGDLTLSVNVNNIFMASQVKKSMDEARRNGADETVIGPFVEQLNNLIGIKMKVNKLGGAELPAKLVTTKIGVDYYAMPAVSFDGQEYTPVTELLDIKSAGYLINIADHCVQPLSTVATSFGVIVGNLIQLFTMQSQPEEPAGE